MNGNSRPVDITLIPHVLSNISFNENSNSFFVVVGIAQGILFLENEPDEEMPSYFVKIDVNKEGKKIILKIQENMVNYLSTRKLDLRKTICEKLGVVGLWMNICVEKI